MTAPGNHQLDARLLGEHGVEVEERLVRHCPRVDRGTSIRYRVDGRPVVSLCSNDYLGFADDLPPTDIREPAGAGASRLVCGDLQTHRAIEVAFADFLGQPDSVLFPSGFQANVGVPACLLRARDIASSDELNHASIIDGLRLSSAERQVVGHLERPRAHPAGLHWWFTESVFSMDGDGPRTVDLQHHLDDGGCLYLDEAHAIGLGAGGHGRGQELNVPTVVVAPLGKAFGCAGAFVAASVATCAWIRAHARSFVFTTGVAPSLVRRIERAQELVRGPVGDERRAALWRNVEVLRSALELDTPSLRSPIVPLIVGSNAAALDLSDALLDRGWHVQAIRPPTVADGSARLRITVSALHEPAELERFGRDLIALRRVAKTRTAAMTR